MKAATMRPRGFGPTRATLVALVLLLAAAGCGDAAREAEIYRVQRGYWLAYRAGQEAAMRGARPDSTELLALRQKFIAAVDQAAPTIKAMGPGKTRSALDERLLRVVGFGEIQAGRLAMDAGRPDLALERCRALVSHAEGDTAVTRQADIMIAGALRRMGRHEEAIEAMRGMLERYPPHPPDSTGVEDFILTIPTLIVSTRKDMGDEAGAKRELEASRVYYEGLLSQAPLDPRLEAQVRLHLVHS
ncbi:MAG TPA: tetratricopeptide repeat protein, partial [Candidatus Eisenbacteria bacterium]|nr:tetratricopeptide repeat protein [Candidatus Eisenbacteria bacterium]